MGVCAGIGGASCSARLRGAAVHELWPLGLRRLLSPWISGLFPCIAAVQFEVAPALRDGGGPSRSARRASGMFFIGLEDSAAGVGRQRSAFPGHSMSEKK